MIKILFFVIFSVSNAFKNTPNKLDISQYKQNKNTDKEFNDLYLSDERFIDDYNKFLKNEKIKLQKENQKTVATIEQQPNNLMFLNNINFSDMISLSILLYIIVNTFSSGFIKVPNWFQSKNDNTKFNLKKENITISSFAGSPEILDEFSDIILFFKNFNKYKNAGATVPKGYLLEGPPGCGKTLLAKIIASECNVNFISVSGSDFVELYVGNGARKIRNLFDEARKNKPAIIFIDEIDAVGRQRSSSSITNGNQEQEQTLNQLLYEMDGFNNNDNIIIIGATNRKDMLDKALLRPNRFDRIITIQPPDFESRKKILELYLFNKKYDKNIIIEHIADLTNGMSGADLKNLINEAIISSIKRNSTMIENTDILNSLDKILIGIIKRNDTRTSETKNRIAIHELGHGFLVKYFSDYFRLSKITIKPTYSNVGGFTIFSNKDDVFQTKDSLRKRLIVMLGGKACENIYFGDDGTSIGASMDLKEANELAYNMITKFGLGDTLINNKESSELTKSNIDNEVINLLSECYDEAKNILSNNKLLIDDLIIKLLEKETIYDYDF
jgi:cell division protease FtsH